MDDAPTTALPPRRGSRAASFLRRHGSLIAIVLVALAYAQPIQALGWNQTSHYALVRALAHGKTDIDAYKDTTGDKAKDPNGHWYSSRAPGLAFYMLPAYKVMTALNIDHITHKNIAGKKNDEMIWALGLWGTVLPAMAMLLLVRWLADRFEPGYGTAAAVTLGLATLILPFSTLLFSHLFSALLGFAAFVLLWRERERGSPAPRLLVSALAGLLVGYGFTTEYPLFIVGLVLGVYLLATFPDRVKHALVYIGGGILGVIPLMLYDKAAFGSFTHVAYADLPKHHRGFFGINVPNPKVAAELLFSSRGLLTLAPVLALSVAGTVWMYRRGRRAEALVIAAVIMAAHVTPRIGLTWRSVGAGLLTVGVWAPLAIFAPRVLGIDHQAELRIVAAGDPTAVHEQFGSHPISRLVLLALLVSIAFMLIAWLVSWWTGRRRAKTAEWTPAVPSAAAREPTAAAT